MLAICLVLVGHLQGTGGFGDLDYGVARYARLGVLLSYVISGFLITTILLREERRTGTISLKRFYLRRALRLFPACYVYIASVAALWFAGYLSFPAKNLWHAITYTTNYLPDRAWELGHLWSLAVEEQFYLLWPFALVWMGVSRGPYLACAVLIIAPLARIVNRFVLIGTPLYDLPMFPMVAGTLAAGCLLAHKRAWLEQQAWYLRLFRPAWSLSLLAAVLILHLFMGYTVVRVFGMAFVNLALAVLVHRCIHCSNDWIGKALNLPAIRAVAPITYSLFLWQQLFLNRFGKAWVQQFPQNLVFAIVAALLSYQLVEKPFLRLRARLRA